MKKKVRKKVCKKTPIWYYRHGDERYPVSANALVDMFEILFDEILIAGDQHMTMFLMDMMQAFREGKSVNKQFGMVARHKWLKELQ